jgi:hypothetical protein
MPKRGPKLPGTETPVDVHKQINRRHAAVLGLGALIEAFPYATPPPMWMPEVLATVARRAAGDPGVVGKAAKGILSEFKKTRQDSWTVDQKVRIPNILTLSANREEMLTFFLIVLHSGATRGLGRSLVEELLCLIALFVILVHFFSSEKKIACRGGSLGIVDANILQIRHQAFRHRHLVFG